MQLGKLQEIESQLIDLGYQILAISPDTPETLQPTVDKHKLNFSIYSDTGLAAAKALGIAFRLDDDTAKQYAGFGIPLGEEQALPVPAVFVYNKGKLTFEYVHPDYKIRLSPDVLLAAAKAGIGK